MIFELFISLSLYNLLREILLSSMKQTKENPPAKVKCDVFALGDVCHVCLRALGQRRVFSSTLPCSLEAVSFIETGAWVLSL